MGADGGTVPKRAELIKQKRKEERLDAVEHAKLRLNFCALSGNALANVPENIVCDANGNLFNLETVLEYLLDAKKKSQLKEEFGIRKMKDVIKIKAEMNPEYVGTEGLEETFVAPFLCPFTGHPSNGVIKFVVIRPCGHVMSHRALKEMGEPHGKKHAENGDIAPPHLVAKPDELPSSGSTTSNTPHSRTDSSQCLTCKAPYNPTTDVIELASDSPSLSASSKDKSAPKAKKRAHDQQKHEEAASKAVAPVGTEESLPDPKRPKLA